MSILKINLKKGINLRLLFTIFEGEKDSDGSKIWFGDVRKKHQNDSKMAKAVIGNWHNNLEKNYTKTTSLKLICRDTIPPNWFV